MVMKSAKAYAELATQAEEATKSIKDPELRRVAFERVLDDLLSCGGSAGDAIRRSLKHVAQPSGSLEKTPPSHGPKGYVRELFREGFFKKPKTIAEVKAELANHGHHIARTSLSGPLQKLCQERILRRQKATAGSKDKKAMYKYSNW
jgi:hypothetical protein